jgi:hypothetical protein
MNTAPQEIVNELKYAVRARQILRWATLSNHTKYSKNLSKEIDTRVQENLKTLENMIWNRPICICMSVYVSAGAVPTLVSLLSSRKGAEAENAALALRNIGRGNAACKAACVSAGAVPALVSLLSSSKGREAQWAAGALVNIAAGDDACKAACVSAGVVPALVKLMPLAKYYSPRLTLIFIANHSPKYRKLVIDAGFNPR